MGSAELDRKSLHRLVTDTVLGPGFRRATFGGVQRGVPSPWVRVVIRPVQLRDGDYWQFSYFDAKKNVTKNLRGREVGERLRELVEAGFAGVHLSTDIEEIDIRTTKRGKLLIGRRPIDTPSPVPSHAHNQGKDVPLPEGTADRLLDALGILTRDGQVRPTMRAKFTQINEFLKHLRHVLDDAGLRSLGRAVQILDCGCGASYLTLAAHHYLNDVLGIPARVTGVDVNDEMIRKSVERADQLGADGIEFVCGPIDDAVGKPDIVVALHACDTATDDALARAVAGEARLILSVPCCHHDLNKVIRPDGPASVLRPLLRHGILRERTADLVTDSFRALALRIMGYRTDVVEFISIEHTARNLMIRAVHGVPIGERALVDEYLQMRLFWGVTPYIERALGEPFQRILNYGTDAVGPPR